jgi:hypothetical protein
MTITLDPAIIRKKVVLLRSAVASNTQYSETANDKLYVVVYRDLEQGALSPNMKKTCAGQHRRDLFPLSCVSPFQVPTRLRPGADRFMSRHVAVSFHLYTWYLRVDTRYVEFLFRYNPRPSTLNPKT